MKEEIEELREYVDRLEEHSHRRKLRLLEQVTRFSLKNPKCLIINLALFYFVPTWNDTAFDGCLFVRLIIISSYYHQSLLYHDCIWLRLAPFDLIVFVMHLSIVPVHDCRLL